MFWIGGPFWFVFGLFSGVRDSFLAFRLCFPTFRFPFPAVFSDLPAVSCVAAVMASACITGFLARVSDMIVADSVVVGVHIGAVIGNGAGTAVRIVISIAMAGRKGAEGSC